MKPANEFQGRPLKENPFLSFIIPVFNEEAFLKQCLQSVTNLEFSGYPYEIIILDNGSTDYSHKIMHELGFQFQVKQGLHVGALRNYGARMAKGEICVFMDSDVELSPAWLQRGLDGLKDDDVVAIAGPRGMPHDPTWVQKVWNYNRHSTEIRQKVVPVAWHPTMAFMVRRKDFLAVSGFNEELETAEDVDLGYRLSARGQLLFDPLMQAIHLGEDPDLKTFWQKEVWRGKGNIQGVYSHGLRWDEIPSLGYPMYMICFSILAVAGMSMDWWLGSVGYGLLAIMFLLSPAIALAIKTGFSSDHIKAIPQLFVLYLTYGFARAWSIIKVVGGF